MKKLISYSAFILIFSLLLSACSQNTTKTDKDLPLEKETEHFLLKYSEGDENAAEDMAEVLENAYEDLTVKYQCTPQERITVGIYPTFETMQEIWQNQPSDKTAERSSEVIGFAFRNIPRFNITSPNDWKHSGESYEETLQDAVHELTHVITKPYELPVYLNEGVAFYEQGQLKKKAAFIRFALNNQKGFSFPSSLDELANMDLDEQYGAAYVYGAIFAEYIIQAYGYDGLVEVLKAKGDISVLGIDADNFYNSWLQYVKEHY